MLTRLGAFVGGCALALLGWAPPAQGWVLYRTSSGVPLHWTIDPPAYRVDEALPDGFDARRTTAIIERAFLAWTDIPCAPLSFVSDGLAAGAVADIDDGVSWIVWHRDKAAWDDAYGSLMAAVTVVHFDSVSGELRDADILINIGGKGDWYADQETCDPEDKVYDLQSIVTHEIGHLLGLDHSLDAAATMNANTYRGDCLKRTLALDDLDGYCAIYENPPGPVDAIADGAEATPSDAAGGAERPPGHGSDGCGASPAPAPLALLVALATLAALGLSRRPRRTPVASRTRSVDKRPRA